MARIVVLGGTGRTGRELISQLGERGDDVVAVFRNPSLRNEIAGLGADSVVLDLAAAIVEEIADAMLGADAVVFAAGTRENEDNVDEIDRDGAIKSADAALRAGVKRFIQISAKGARTGFPEGLDEKMLAYYEAKRAGDRYLMGSALDWTVLEPGQLVDTPATGLVEIAESIDGFGSISRADVAAAVIAALNEPASIRRAFEIVGGDDSVELALARASTG